MGTKSRKVGEIGGETEEEEGREDGQEAVEGRGVNERSWSGMR